MQLPEGKGPITVCEEYLVGVFQVLWERLKGEYGEILDETPIEAYITVPAIWGDPAKRYTKTASRRAGFSESPNVKIIIISEPEAAATLALSTYSGCGIRNQIREGAGLMVVDLGGGTVDTTTYLITEVDPEIKFRELIVGEGGKVGSTAVNREFFDFCVDKLGDEFKALPIHKTGPGSTFMNEFEDRKHAFEGPDGLEDSYEIPLRLRNKATCEHYDSVEEVVRFTSSDMESFFKPSVTKILRLLRSQLAKAKVAMPDGGEVGLCVCVGGFAESPYVQSAVRKECEDHGMSARFPHEPQAAIVKGAVLRGLGGIKPDARCCRRHYGFAIAKPFQEGVDPEYLSFIHDYHHRKYCRGRMSWVIEKGDTVDQFTTIEKDLEWCYHDGNALRAIYKLYGCSKYIACKFITHNGVKQVGEIIVDFTNVDLQQFSFKMADGQRVWSIKFNLEVSLGHEEGLLRVRALVGTREFANADFDFNDIESSMTDTTPTLTAPGAPVRHMPTAMGAVPRTPKKPRVGASGSSRLGIITPRKRTASVTELSTLLSPARRPSARKKKKKILQMDTNEISKAEDSE